MKNLKKYPALSQSISNYGRMGIIIEILSMNDREAKIKVMQKDCSNGYLLNQLQLENRVKKVFESTGLKIKIFPCVWTIDVSEITTTYIQEK